MDGLNNQVKNAEIVRLGEKIFIKTKQAGSQWLTLVILATWETEIRRIAV
jgi:hypothetical protein